MIGLKRGTVKLSPYNKKWQTAFEKERQVLKKAAGKILIDIQHIGSTAIPGIHAKPIIDMSAGVRNLKDAKRLVKLFSKMGYNFYKTFQKQILFAKGPDKKRTHYLHVMKYNGTKWKNDLLFRHYLLRHPTRAKTYDTLKKKLARLYPNDREKYTAGKKLFIENTLTLGRRNSLRLWRTR